MITFSVQSTSACKYPPYHVTDTDEDEWMTFSELNFKVAKVTMYTAVFTPNKITNMIDVIRKVHGNLFWRLIFKQQQWRIQNFS